MLDRTSAQVSGTESKQQRLAQAIPLLSPLIGLFTVVLARSTDLGLVGSISLVVIAACSLCAVFGQAFSLTLRRTAKAIQEYYVIPRYVHRLEVFAKRLRRLCDRGYCDNVPYVLRDFPQLWGDPVRDLPALDDLTRFLDTLDLMLSAQRRRKKNMVFLLRCFESILHTYNRQCVCEPAKQVINRVEQGLDQNKKQQYERLKREYEKVKFGYVVFLEQYGEFARDLNSAFAESIARDYFDRPPEL